MRAHFIPSSLEIKCYLGIQETHKEIYCVSVAHVGLYESDSVAALSSTVLVLRMTHRKWKEIKQQPSMLPDPAVPGYCLFSFHILWAILSTSTVLYDEVARHSKVSNSIWERICLCVV